MKGSQAVGAMAEGLAKLVTAPFKADLSMGGSCQKTQRPELGGSVKRGGKCPNEQSKP